MNHHPAHVITSQSSSEPEILIESFSDEEGDIGAENSKKKSLGNDEEDNDKLEQLNDSNVSSADTAAGDKTTESSNSSAEIRRLLRRKDELERRQKMDEAYNQRLRVSFILFLLLSLL